MTAKAQSDRLPPITNVDMAVIRSLAVRAEAALDSLRHECADLLSKTRPGLHARKLTDLRFEAGKMSHNLRRRFPNSTSHGVK